MPPSCPYCGATLSFGLKFCVVCGHQTISASNKMGAIKKSALRRSGLPTRTVDNYASFDYRDEKTSNSFRQTIRTIAQTILYGFIAGAIFLCAIRFSLQTLSLGQVRHMAAPPFQATISDPSDTIGAAGTSSITKRRTQRPRTPNHMPNPTQKLKPGN